MHTLTHSTRFRASALRFFSVLALSAGAARAFPPAPYYTLYGTVRDQTGQVVTAADARVVLLKGTEEAGRAAINSNIQLDQNYEMGVRIDAARPATALYTPAAVPALGQFHLAVEMGGQRLYPIEVSGGALTAGKGGERVKLDLTLGVDSDGDSLPDAWEQWQLFQAGLLPGVIGWDLSKIDRDGDFDGDGQSNWLEYIAGTFAGDATERFALNIKTKTETAVSFEFFAITGKTYTIERSTDLTTWTRVPLTAGPAPAAPAESYRATAVGMVAVQCAPVPGEAREQFRLTVR